MCAFGRRTQQTDRSVCGSSEERAEAEKTRQGSWLGMLFIASDSRHSPRLHQYTINLGEIIVVRKILVVIIVILGFSFGFNYLFQNKQDVNINSKYSNCELGDLVGDDVERIEYQNFYIDYHAEDFTKSQIEEFAQKCVDEAIKNQYQMDCCTRMKMYPAQ